VAFVVRLEMPQMRMAHDEDAVGRQVKALYQGTDKAEFRA